MELQGDRISPVLGCRIVAIALSPQPPPASKVEKRARGRHSSKYKFTTPKMSKRQRTSQQDRIQLDVGGTVFHTNRTTLVGSSAYFHGMWSDESNWTETDHQDELFLDRDSDVFRILLSAMRCGPTCCKLLPRDDLSLCVRVLRDAEFFGIHLLLNEVKINTQKHLHPCDASKHNAEAFDEEHGGIEEAIKVGILPDRIFAAAPPRPKFPRIKQILAASDNAQVRFTVVGHDGIVSRRIACYALIEYPYGTTEIQPVVARRPDGIGCDPEWGDHGDRHRDGQAWGQRHEIGDNFGIDEQLMLFNEWKGRTDAGMAGNMGGWMVCPQGKDVAGDDVEREISLV